MAPDWSARLSGRMGGSVEEAGVRILVVEDDADINRMVTVFLEKQGCRVTQAFSGTEGQLLLTMQEFDLAVMDLMLPGLSGEGLLARLRDKSQMPVIVLTAKSALDDKVQLLAAGADDYMIKPFELEELWARVLVQLRHKGKCARQEERLVFGDWIIDLQARQLTAGGRAVELTAHEFGIVELLAGHPKKVFTRQEIYEAVWQQDAFVEDKTIHVHISNIRAKLRAAGVVDYIQTVWGIGFKLREHTQNGHA